MRCFLFVCIALISWACSQQDTQADPTFVGDYDSSLTEPSALLKVLTQQLVASPNDFTLWQQRAEVYYQLDSIDAAISDIENALILNRNSPDLHYLRGFFAYGKGNLALAKSEYLAAEGIGTQNPDVFYQLGQVYFALQRYDSAIYYYNRAKKFNESDPHYDLALGVLAADRGDISGAVEQYLKAIEVDSTFDKALIQLHKQYMDKPYENEEVAMRYLNQLLRNQPTHPLGRYYEGLYYLRLVERNMSANQLDFFGDALNKAITSFTITTNKQPDYGDGWYYLGYAYFLGQQNMNEAISKFEQAVQVAPDDPKAYFMLGSIFERNGDLQTALGYFQQALALKPGSAGFQRAVREVEARLTK